MSNSSRHCHLPSGGFSLAGNAGSPVLDFWNNVIYLKHECRMAGSMVPVNSSQMTNTGSDIEFIERYLKGTLTPAEAEEFGNRLETDHEFARKFRLRKSFPSLFNAEGEDEIIQAVDKIREENLRENRKARNRSVYLLLSVILVLIVISVVLLATGTIRLKGRKSAPEKAARVNVSKSVRKPALQKPVLPAARKDSAEKAGTRVAPSPSKTTPVETGILLENPADNQVISRSEEILFRWKIDADTFTRLCVESDLSQKVIWWRGIIPGISDYKVAPGTFRPGRFHWYIGTRAVNRTFVIKE